MYISFFVEFMCAVCSGSLERESSSKHSTLAKEFSKKVSTEHLSKKEKKRADTNHEPRTTDENVINI